MNNQTACAYAPLGKDIMPIGAWISPPPPHIFENNPSFISTEYYKAAKEVGLNILYGHYETCEQNPEAVALALKVAKAAGIHYLAALCSIEKGIPVDESLKTVIKATASAEACLGHISIDEPALPQLPALKALHEYYKSHCGESLFYVNLLPCTAKKNQLYEDKTDESGDKATPQEYLFYLEAFISQIEPRFISYDYYPCFGDFPNLQKEYFLNLSLIRGMALKHQIPFWTFIQSSSWTQGVRTPTLNEIQWQVNTALAYGAQGIQYFTFWQPLHAKNWDGAIFDDKGHKTRTFAAVQYINQHISALAPVLMNSKSLGIIQHRSSPCPIPEKDLIKQGMSIRLEGELPALAGCFTHNGKPAYLVVNNSIDRSGEVGVTLPQKETFRQHYRCKSMMQTTQTISLELNAGEAVLLEIM